MRFGSWFLRGGAALALLGLLTIGAMRPAPAAPQARSGSRVTICKARSGAIARAAGTSGGVGGSGAVVAWGTTPPLPAGLSDVVSLEAGREHSAALRSDGTVVIWGAGPAVTSPIPEGLTGVIAISAGRAHTLALKADGTVVAWGDDLFGQATVPPGLSNVRAIDAGFFHNLALKSDGTVVTWAGNTPAVQTVPAALDHVVAVSAGWMHSLALKADGTVTAWGDNQFGQLDVPAGLTGVVAIAAGEMHNLALKSDGTVVAWGQGHDGVSRVPAAVPDGLSNVVAISTNLNHNLALKSEGIVVAWGSNTRGQTNVPTLSGATAIAAGFYHSMALRATSTVRSPAVAPPSGLNRVRAVSTEIHALALQSDGTVRGWGSGSNGKATPPAGLSNVVAIGAGYQHSMALKSDGTVAVWGLNNYGQTAVPEDLRQVVAISSGSEHCLALKSDGTVVAWGRNHFGQTEVPSGLQNVVAISAGWNFNLALKSDGTVVAWGDDREGQSTVPAGLSGVRAVEAGPSTSVVLKSDGTVETWGSSAAGMRDVPADLPPVRTMSCGADGCLVVLADGTVTGWGTSIGTALAGMSGIRASAVSVGNQMTVAVTANSAPSITPPAAVTSEEDTPSGFRSFTVGDDGGASAVTLSATSSVPGLVQSFGFNGTGTSRGINITPAANANGTATITLTASDGSASSTATFTFTVTAVNDAPSFTRGSNQVVSEDAGPQSIPGWATNLKPGPTTDEYTQTLTFQVTGNTNSALFSAAPAVNGTTGELTYTPAPNKNGQATITLRVRDNGGTVNGGQDSSATQTFTIQVNAVNDAPTATGQSVTTAEDTAKALTLSAADVDGDTLTYSIETPPAHGTLSGTGANRTYTPAPNYHGPDSFTFKVNDGTMDSNVATVSLTVTPVNDLPVATGESYATPRGTTLEIAPVGVLGNDTDVDGDPLTAQLVSNPTGGTLTFNPNGSFRYTPRIAFSGTDTFTYRAHDGTAAGNTVTVSLEVSATPPVSTPDGQVEASGTIPVPGGNASFTLSARKSGAKVVGTLTYTDPVRTRTLTSTELTAVVVTGRKARVFGKGRLVNGTLVDFVVDVEDVADPGRGKDRFQLESGSGSTVGAVLSLGNITVRP